MDNKMKLIINADDLGWNSQRDSGILKLFESGAITSSTVLMNGYNTKKVLQ